MIPLQTEGLAPRVIPGDGITFTVTVEELEHPEGNAAVTVYSVVSAGDTLTDIPDKAPG